MSATDGAAPDGPVTLVIDSPASTIGLAELHGIQRRGASVRLGGEAAHAVRAARDTVTQVVRAGRVVYGITTGFGQLAQTVIEPGHLAELQANLVRSTCAGVGPPLDDRVIRLVLVLKVLSLTRGLSGVRPEVIEVLARLLEREVYPVVPTKGSVGASGDLAPLAHLAAVLIGEGEVRHGGRTLPAAEGLALAGLEPLVLEPKEGLALVNGTQVSTALALTALFGTAELLAAATVAGAMSVEAIAGSHVPFDERIHAARRQPGQMALAAAYRRLLRGSEIVTSHVDCGRVQDPYCLRCQPQVMGACLDVARSAARTIELEANAVTDNPLVFQDTGDVLSGGNFHAEPVALAADMLALAIAEIGALSERRVALLVDSHMSGLPPFLTEHSGLRSGFMIPQVTAAALASENKSLAHPASVDSLPTSANQEDHVSMATFAASRLREMIENTAGIVAIELMAAAQGLDFRRPLATSPALTAEHAGIRDIVPALDADRALSADIEAVRSHVLSGVYRPRVPEISLDGSDGS